jgi:DNA-binding MarR family transcriptional regulator
VDESAQVTATTVVDAGPSPSMGQPLDAAEELIQLSRIVQDIHARTSQRHSLPPVQAKLLCVLAFGPRGMAELAKCFGVEKAALTGLVDRAERRGFVSRSPVIGDRRALRVTLTSSGRQAAAAFHADASAELNQLLSPLAPSEREDFRTALAKIITTRTQSPARTQVGPPPPGGLQPSAQ